MPALEAILIRETGTLGVRRHTCQRTVRPRETGSVATPWGPVAVKRAGAPGQVTPEYEDAARLAREHGVPLRAVYAEVSGYRP